MKVNKFFIILLIILLLLFSFTGIVKADFLGSYTIYNDVQYDFPTLPTEVTSKPYYFIIKRQNDNMKVVASDRPFSIVSDNEGGVKINCDTDRDGHIAYDYIVGSDEWTSTDYIYEDFWRFGIWFEKVYTSYDMYYDGNSFFYTTPLFPMGIIQQEMKETAMTGVVKEIISLLPLIIVVVVSFLGLRKGYRFLLTLLRRS